MVAFTFLSPLSNLFCSTSLKAQLTLYRSKGRWKLTKLNHTGLYAHEVSRSFFHHNITVILCCLFKAVLFFIHPSVSEQCKYYLYEFYNHCTEGLFFTHGLLFIIVVGFKICASMNHPHCHKVEVFS